jgi:hypothetical protein
MTDPARPPLGARPIAASAAGRIRRVAYDPAGSLADARRVYFEANGFPPDGGYQAEWVDFALGPIPMPFPNTDGRRRAVVIHDLHHVLTGYATDIYGEAEISAWELAAGCKGMLAAWALDLGGMALGVLIAPRRTFRAWVRGRRSRTLYGVPLDAALLDRTVGEVRGEMGVDQPPGPVTVGDALSFFLYWQVGAWGSLAVMPLAIVSASGAALAGLVRGRSRKAA